MPRIQDDSLTRREALRLGGLAALGLGLSPRLLAAARDSRVRACILVWLDGGPSHIDTFDPKPDAPREIRGAFRAIPTSVPGLSFCELLPRTAQIADRLTVIHSLTSQLGEHALGSHYLLTGYEPTPALVYPSMGAVLAREVSDTRVDALPPYVAIGDRPNPHAGSGYLPPRFDPFMVVGRSALGDIEVRDLELPAGMSPERLDRRRRFLEAFDHGSVDPQFEQAYRLVSSSDARGAFSLAEESAETRARYGQRTVGQSCLLARRLVERGVPFVVVTDRGWDTHTELYRTLKEGHTGGDVGKVPNLDRALSSLVEDLEARKLFDSTLVVVTGEFGRTPKVNRNGGRDHWPRVFSAVLAGGPVPRGAVIGASDDFGESPVERPVTPRDLVRTIYTILGIDPDQRLTTPDGRPVSLVRGGRVIEELLG